MYLAKSGSILAIIENGQAAPVNKEVKKEEQKKEVSNIKKPKTNVELNHIKTFESEIIEKIKTEKAEILDSIQSSGKLEKEVEESLIQIIEEYKKSKK